MGPPVIARFLQVASAALVIAMASCTGARRGGTDDAGVPPANAQAAEAAVAAFEASLYRAICTRLANCWYSSVEGCLNRLQGSLGYYVNFEAELAAIRDGRARFDADAAAQCLAAFVNVPGCNFVLPMRDIPACNDTFIGLAPSGGSCHAQEECPAGEYCEFTISCPGRCVPQMGAGQSVPSPVLCTTALFAESCLHLGCLSGLYNQEGGCAPRVPIGGSCAPVSQYDRLCVVDSYCEPTTHLCEPLRDVGAACSSGDVCKSHHCNLYTSTCHQSSLGADCRYYPIRELCPADLACTDYVDGGTCVPARAQGERCFITNDCQPGLFCDGTTCAPLRSVGEPCTMNLGNPSVPTQSGYVFCAAGLYCELANGPPGICTPLKRAGETCRWDFYCAFGLKCLGDGTGKDVCTRPHCADPTP